MPAHTARILCQSPLRALFASLNPPPVQSGKKGAAACLRKNRAADALKYVSRLTLFLPTDAEPFCQILEAPVTASFHLALRSRKQKSASSQYIKNCSSRRPTLSSASRDTSMLAPVMKSTASSGTGARKCREWPSQKFTCPPPHA